MLHRAQERVSITFMSGPLDGKTMTWSVPDVGTELLITIGRRDGCDIMLDYDSQVSRQHARVIYELTSKQFFVEDTNSRNGTYIGTEKLTGRSELQRGQLFRAGRTWLRVDPIRPEPELVEDLENFLVRDDEGNSTRGNTPF
jgi:pSer/pThr/pTyr-binding forkhead associated (FHA) protein